MAYLTEKQLNSVGFLRIGKDVKISEKASIYNPECIEIGNDVRIDDFCVLSSGSGGISIGSNVHIGVFCFLAGQENIVVEDFVGISSRVSIYSSCDDFSGESLTNPTVPEKYKNVKHGKVYLGRHVVIGSGSVILPNVTIGTGAAVAALSLVTRSVPDFTIVSGISARRVGVRKRNLLELEKHFRQEMSKS
jgi:acetyltransferase-like isoleucine patch superfamily enzyme